VSIANTATEDALAGDQRAFMELLEPELPGAYRLAIGMLRHQAEAEDAVQDAVLNAWRSFNRFRRGSELRPWLFAIVANQCRRRRRSRWWYVITGWSATDDGPDMVSALDPAAADLRRALNRLPHDQRAVLVLRYYLDLSFEEVAQTLGVSTKAAMSRTYRALRSLRMTPEVLSDG
jgi:RNA polymerase sigma-70 factor, ECF subfamily